MPKGTAVFLAAFGLLTMFLSGSLIFDLFDVRAGQGHYVLIVVWANFISSFLYLFAAYGFMTLKGWTPLPLGLSLGILIVAFIGLVIHISSGGLYMTKTIGAMIFRIAVTLLLTVLAYFKIIKKTRNSKLCS